MYNNFIAGHNNKQKAYKLKMQARSSHMTLNSNYLSLPRTSKPTNSSLSTCGSNSPREYPESSLRKYSQNNESYKEKSQLCKKFIENGFCPYEKKCKFAHGCHELRRHQQANMKYKTKECGLFVRQGYCPFGERCNFIHERIKVKGLVQEIDEGFIEVKSGIGNQSRLMRMLEAEKQAN